MARELISFGDNVQVRDTAVTRAHSVAGLAGPVYGVTTPSATGVDVIGELTDDCAINVYFEERDEQLWFGPDLLQLVDHGAGTEVMIKTEAGDKKWMRTESGEWEDSPGGERSASLFPRIVDFLFGRQTKQ